MQSPSTSKHIYYLVGVVVVSLLVLFHTDINTEHDKRTRIQ